MAEFAGPIGAGGRRERWILLATLAALLALSWFAAARMALQPHQAHHHGAGLGGLFAMWAAMTVAMMLSTRNGM